MNHKDLDVWKLSMTFVKDIYQLTSKFPDSEKFGIVSQLRRAAVSIPTNIAEGAARQSDKEFTQFLYISLGSLSEAETLVSISNDLGFINDLSKKITAEQIEKIRPLILGLIKYLKRKTSN